MSDEREVAIGLVLNAARFNPAAAQAAGGLATLAGEAAKADGDVRRLEASLAIAAADLKRVEAEAARTAQQLRGLEGELAKTSGELRVMREQAKASQAEALRLAGTIGQLTTRVGTLEAEAKRAAGEMARLDAEAKKAAAGMARMEAESKRAAAELALVRQQAAASAAELTRMQTSADQASVGTTGLSSAIGLLKGALAVIGFGVAAKELFDFGKQAIDASESLNQYQIRVAAVISANEKITDSQGKAVTGIEKFKVAQEQASGIFKKLQQDALMTSDTTPGLIEKFTAALGPGLAAGMSLDEVENLTVSLSTAMTALGIDASQAKSEVKALLSGENLDDADLARALGVRREDIQLAKEQGKLYDMLMGKMADFRTAGAKQAATLTGIASSLDDVRGKLMAVMGTNATEVLTEGFGDVLESIQNADGSLTPLGESLSEVASHAGKVTAYIAGQFVWLTKAVLSAAEKINEVARVASFNTQIMGIHGGIVGNINSLKAKTIKVDGATMTVGEAMKQRDTARRASQNGGDPRYGFFGPSMVDPVNAARRLGQFNAALKPYDREVERLKDPNLPERMMDKIADDVYHSGPSGNKPAEQLGPPEPAGSGFDIQFNRPTGGGKKAGKGKKAGGAKGKDPGDVAVSELLSSMNRELALADAFGPENALEKRIPIMQRYLAALGNMSKGQEEAADLDRKIEQERAKNSADVVKRSQVAADKQLEVQRIGGESLLKIATTHAKTELAIQKTQSEEAQRTLQVRFAQGIESATTYYEGLARLRQQEIETQTKNTRDQLLGERALLQGEFKNESGRTKATGFDEAKVRRVKAQIDELDAQLADLPKEQQAAIESAWNGARGEIESATRDATLKGLETALDAGIKILGIQIPGQLQQGLTNAIQQAVASSGIASKIPGLASLASGPQAAGLQLLLSVFTGFITELRAQDERNKAARAEATQRVRDLNPTLAGDMASIEEWRKQQLAKVTLSAGTGPSAPTQYEADVETEAEFKRREALKRDQQRKDSGLETQSVFLRDVDTQQRKAFARMRAQGIDTTQQEIDQVQKLLAVWTGLPIYRAEKLEELADLQDRLRDENLAKEEAAYQREMEWARKAADERTAQAKRAADAAVDQLRRVRTEQDKDLDAKQNSDAILAIYGFKSATSVGLDDQKARMQANKDEISRLAKANVASRAQQSPLLDRLGSLRLTNNNEKTIDDGNFYLGKNSNLNFAANLGTLDGDREKLMNFIRAKGTVTDRTTGQQLSIRELGDLFDRVSGLESNISGNDNRAEELRKANEASGIDRNKQVATIRTAAERALADLNAERAKAEAGSDPAKMKEYLKAQADSEYKARKAALEQSGILTDVTDPATRARILSNLDNLRNYAKAEADKADPSEQNPLPVRVVEMPKLFALPTASYFRDQRQPAVITQQLSVDQIRIEGSGLTPSELQSAIVGAIKAAPFQVTKVINRENRLTDTTIRL